MSEDLLLKDPDDDNYQDAFGSFIRKLTNLYIDRDSASLWIAFSGGVYRKIDLKNGTRSPVYHIANEMFENQNFHGRLTKTEENEFLIEEHRDRYRVDFPMGDEYNETDIIPVELQKIKENITLSENLEQAREDFGFIIIKINDTDNEKDLSEALDTIVKLTENIGEIKKGDTLKFKIKSKSKTLEEEEFFQRAVLLHGGEKNIKRILKNFSSFADSGLLYYDMETVSFGYAAFHLLIHNYKNIKTIVEYLSAIDFEHDVYCREKIIPELVKLHARHGRTTVKLLSKISDGAWLDVYNEWLED
jgi:hypothetical protein